MPRDPQTGNLVKQVTIFCDGSSPGNGREVTPAAAVALLGYQGLWRAFGTYLGKATNQQAEIAAAALGLEALKEPCRVSLHTDSRYVIETMKGSFRRKTNHDWWKRLDEAASRHRIEWQWSQGHAGQVIHENQSGGFVWRRSSPFQFALSSARKPPVVVGNGRTLCRRGTRSARYVSPATSCTAGRSDQTA